MITRSIIAYKFRSYDFKINNQYSKQPKKSSSYNNYDPQAWMVNQFYYNAYNNPYK